MPKTLYSWDEFAKMHGNDQIHVPQVGRLVFSDGATALQQPWGPEMFEPPQSEHDRLELQYLRAVELVERSHQDFLKLKRVAVALGDSSAIPKLLELRAQYMKAKALMNQLHDKLMATPQERRKAEVARARRHAEELAMRQQGVARAEIAKITLDDSEPAEALTLTERIVYNGYHR